MKILQILVLCLGLTVFINGQTKDKSILSGNVYDANGALIVGAKVTAINGKGEKFETITDDQGIYVLNLPFNLYNPKPDFNVSKYEIAVSKEGFERNFIKDFKFVPSSKSKMILDFALDVFVNINTIIVDLNN